MEDRPVTMKHIAKGLREMLGEVLPLLQDITENDASRRPSPDKWSKKEILGHLIDSACNNQQKFVRSMAQQRVDFVGYQQNVWVDVQNYNGAIWRDLIDFWRAYNLHLSSIIETVSPSLLANTITIEDGGTFSLRFMMEDYVEHLKHHLNQISPAISLSTSYPNIYNT